MAGMVSMARSPEALKKDSSYGTAVPMADTPDQPVYPYGLCLSLGDEELEKLGLGSDCEVGDEISFVARAEVTSESEHKTPDGSRCRIELQIVAMKVAGPDMEEGKSRRYKGSSL